MKRLVARALLLALAYASLASAQEPAPEGPPSAPAEAPAAPEPAPTAPAPEPPPAAPAEPAPAEPPAPPAAEPAPPPVAPPPSSTAAPPAPPPPTASFGTAPVPPVPRPNTVPPPASATSASPPKNGHPAGEEAKDDKEKEKDDRNGLLGPFRIGPVVGVGLPSLINVGGVIKLTPYFAAGISIGVAPEVSFAYYGDATVSYHAYELYAHVHPFGGGLYFGAAVGYALAGATSEQVVSLPSAVRALYPELGASVTLRSEGNVQTMVLTPELGYFYTFKSGFSLGVGAGFQIPIAPSEIEFEQDVNQDVPEEILRQYLDPTARAVEDSLEKIGQTMLPTVGVSIGWLL